MALFRKAERTRSRARLVYRADGGSFALIPRVDLTLCNSLCVSYFGSPPEDWSAPSDSRFAQSLCFLKK